MSLPRDLSYSGAGSVAQAFVPELKKLRRTHTTMYNASLRGVSADKALFLPKAAFGPQLEVSATFRVSSESVGAFGLLVLASNASATVPAERTRIRFDLQRKMVQLDRTQSGAAVDADVR